MSGPSSPARAARGARSRRRAARCSGSGRSQPRCRPATDPRRPEDVFHLAGPVAQRVLRHRLQLVAIAAQSSCGPEGRRRRGCDRHRRRRRLRVARLAEGCGRDLRGAAARAARPASSGWSWATDSGARRRRCRPGAPERSARAPLAGHDLIDVQRRMLDRVRGLDLDHRTRVVAEGERPVRLVGDVARLARVRARRARPRTRMITPVPAADRIITLPLSLRSLRNLSSAFMSTQAA